MATAKKMGKAQNGVKKPLIPAPVKKTGMDALKGLGEYVSTFGYAKEKYNPAPSKEAKKSMPESKMKKGGTVKAKDGKWIQKAVNPAHKGYCTPMTKATCTPKRKALAKTFKAMGRARKGK